MTKDIQQWAEMCQHQYLTEDISSIDRDIQTCHKEQSKYKKAQFDIFKFEGQQLANIWDMLGKTLSQLKNGDVEKALFYLDHLGNELTGANAVDMPEPTNPRDIR